MAMMATSGIPEPSVSRYGLTQVYAPSGGGLVDVVFVHGLNGDPHNTWTAEKSKTFWPAQLLPLIVEEERARILVYGYDADVSSFTDGASRDKIHNHAEHLIAELAANRRIRKATERPIIFVAHSLGGLVVKRALIYSSEIRGNYTEHLRSIFVSTYGVLFLGTPHKGSDLAKWGSRLEAICKAVIPTAAVDMNDNLVNALKRNNETLQNIDRQFIQLMSRFHIYFFHEGKPTNLKGKMDFIVDEESASPTVQDVERAVIQADHSHMCKFENDSAPGFDLVAEGIQRYAGEAPKTISARWEAEKAERIAKKKAEVAEMFPGSKLGTQSDSETSSPDDSVILSDKQSPQPELKDGVPNLPSSPNKPTEPYFIVPPGFRKNTFFVGMEKEKQELDRRLFDKRRRDGTACVLIYGQPGSGKSHLARQYVYQERRKFPGGIFWISSRLDEERKMAFWNIMLKVVARDSPDLCEGVNPHDFVQLVKAWFESRHEWLIVFDGVSVELDEDTTALAQFVPDSRDSSIIYISRAQNLESKQRLLRPFPIKVRPLKEEDAKKLLFKELHNKNPNEADNRKATEIVKKIGGLPLAIDAISHRLADTHEPLAKYKLSYSADPTIESTYNKILDDMLQLGHTEAWNLIHIICWFAPDLPVEMIYLGMKILRADNIDIKATEPGGRPDINTTFGELMRYALIERNEPDDKDSMTSSRDSLTDPEPIDMLKIHRVVQNFCCDSLNARGLLTQWLGYAVRLFSFSFHNADIKIKQKSGTGRVSDYRYYKVHGQRLWEHSVSYESKTQRLKSIREVLEPVLNMIDDAIQLLQPRASQESLPTGVLQVSIFDRTSSSSESNNSLDGPITPDYRPTPPPLDGQTIFGFPQDKAVDSPGSFATASPGIHPKILGSPRLPEFEDFGYEGDQEARRAGYPMRQNPSDMTERPSARSRAPTTESQGGDWTTVSSNRRSKKQPRKRRDLGSFRPTPARAQVNPQSVTASLARSKEDGRENRRGSSPAFKSLEKAQSPPPRNRIASFFHRNSSPTSATKPQPLWSSVAAGTATPLQQRPGNIHRPTQDGPSTAPLILEHNRPNEGPRPTSGQGSIQPSPLASEFIPYPDMPGTENVRPGPSVVPYPTEYPPTSFQYTTSRPGSNASLSQLPQTRPLDMVNPYYTPPPPTGPNPNPLPYNDNVSITSKRPYPYDSPGQRSPSAFSSPPSNQPSPLSQQVSPYQPVYDVPYPPPIMPAGYYSQPMSHASGSRQSHDSVAETDPIRYPSDISPSMLPSAVRSRSPRDRDPDGRPYRKSPKTDHAVPIFPPSTSPRVSPHDLSQMGGWTTATPPPPVTYDTNMSRSSSGPGVAISDAPTMGIVQFGDHPPISVEEARMRTWTQEQRLRERRRGSPAGPGNGGGTNAASLRDLRRESAPYPDVNLIPTISHDIPAGASNAGFSGRPRGMSAPAMEEGVGLGVRMA